MTSPSEKLRRSNRKPLTMADQTFRSLGTNPKSGLTERHLRTTPRNSFAGETLFDEAKETPYASLRQLAGLIHQPATPLRRALSTGISSRRRSIRRTTSAQNRTPNASGMVPLRVTPIKRSLPTTPHALRAIQQRRAAALTPGRDRRRSGRLQRETPRDVLRNLSRVLAQKTNVTESSPHPAQYQLKGTSADDDLENEPDPMRPRMSLGIEYDEDDSFHLPPRLSIPLEDENHTLQSVELPRRATSEQPFGRLSNGSFGSMLMTDRFADLDDLAQGLALEREEIAWMPEDFGVYDESLGQQDAEMDDESVTQSHVYLSLTDGQHSDQTPTEDLQRILAKESTGRTSDVRNDIHPNDNDEATFMFAIPTNSIDPVSPQVEVEVVPDKELMSAKKLAKNAESWDRVKRKDKKISAHGIPYPQLPTSVIKRLMLRFGRGCGTSKPKISKEALTAIEQASDLFFQQISDDLASYSRHAHKKTIDEGDMAVLMRRQRQTNSTTTPFSLAQRHLPRELLQDMRMALGPNLRTGKRRVLAVVDEEEDE